MAKEIKRRELLQLAETYVANKFKVAGLWVSEKLDGTRCKWDGGISREVATDKVPWAGILDPKTMKKKAKIKPVATGLWSRYGNPIMAPDWFLNSLPACPLDGELWAGRGKFQLCRSICAGDTPDPRFNQISYAVYSSPSFEDFLAPGLIKNAQMYCDIKADAVEWANDRAKSIPGFAQVHNPATFDEELMFLREFLETQNDKVFIHQQFKLPTVEAEALAFLEELLEAVLDKGGEGLVIRDPASSWTAKRHKGLLKFKPYEDSEGVIVGYTSGKPGKEGNRLGKIGALIVKWGDKEFKVASGLSGKTWEFKDQLMSQFAAEHPDEIMPKNFEGKTLGKGDTITFKYRELSDDGIPKEGRFWRLRGIE